MEVTKIRLLCEIILKVLDNGLTLFPSMGILLFALTKTDLRKIPSSGANSYIYLRSFVT